MVGQPYSAAVWAAPIWAAIPVHPFFAETRAGTPLLEGFRYFVTQDNHHL